MSANENKKPDYDESLFLVLLPGFIFLCLATIVMVISIVEVKPSRNPIPEPMLTIEESVALIAPISSSSSGSSGGAESLGKLDGGNEGLSIIMKNDCVACHKDTIKVIGPAYADVAAKYKGDKAALKKLAEKIKLGGSGVWGEIPMSPHPSLKEEELDKILKYILSLKGGKAPEVIIKAEPSPKKSEALVNNPKVDDAIKFMKEKSDCFACHRENEKLVGPSFEEIGKKYTADKDAVKNLAIKIKLGGAGVWGQIPMLPHPNLSEVELENLTVAILSYGSVSINPPSNNYAPIFDMMKNKSDCYVCHKDREVMVGPSYLEVSKKYKDIKEIKPLVEKIKKGGVGVWGPVPMIAHPQLTEEEIEKMVQAILSIK